MILKNLIFITNLLFLSDLAQADSEPYPPRLLTPQELKVQEALQKEAAKEIEASSKKNANVGDIKIYDLMENGTLIGDFLIFDPVGEVIKEEQKYSKLDNESKNEYLYEKQEKIRNFTEKRFIERFLNFNFGTKNINDLSYNSPDNTNRHLPLAIVKEQLTLSAFKSASEGNLTTLRALLEQNKIKIDATDKSGRTLLIYAVDRNQVNVVRFLIVQGASINHADLNSNTALNYAIKNKNAKMCDLLLSFGAKTNSPEVSTQKTE